MTGMDDTRFPKSLMGSDRIVTDNQWDLATYGSTPFSDFFGLPMLSAMSVWTGLMTRRPTPLSSAVHLPTIARRRSKTRLRTGMRLLSLGRR
ncbi:hypothetical protein RGUI_3464 [Rhodovulum sp. P5]|uniref:hypothetical protein n=1 Tax=Rhodovulum sp. P5 TaxID=1564506 RepID=UPI0009C1F8AB|nr:hypothetical protein [Rhodovulum sp. P5]ARE41605.1 hypothetical protein RGUI_3464 [Rhodovulum sp. P5]